jgi:hypothetical protein
VNLVAIGAKRTSPREWRNSFATDPRALAWFIRLGAAVGTWWQ